MTVNQNINVLVVLLNSSKVLEYYRNRPLTAKQQADLDALDKKLDTGIHLNHQHIANPNLQDKATFVANLLVSALLNGEDAKAALTCAYLGTRFSDLKQVVANSHPDQLAIQLIYDEEYREQSPIHFVSKDELL